MARDYNNATVKNTAVYNIIPAYGVYVTEHFRSNLMCKTHDTAMATSRDEH